MMLPTNPLAPGSAVGPWVVLERLDHGGFGVVYLVQRAGHPEAGTFALKVARHPWDERFDREAELLRRLRHPSAPRFEDEGAWTGPSGYHYPYLVMEWVPGLSLYDWMREQPRTSRQLLKVAAQVASALATAHADGNLHRDVKGSNIRVQADGRAVLLDWGSGWFSGAQPLTDTLMAPGTRAYRPPEQKDFMWQFRANRKARWQSVPADDLYALGVTLYRAVTGVYLPPNTEGEGVVARDIVRPRDLATVCPELEALILRLVSDDPKARGTAEQLAREAQEAADTPGPEADKPILPTAHALPKEEGSAPSADSSWSDELSDADRASSERRSSSGSSRGSSAHPRRRRSRPPTLVNWLSWASAALVGGLVVAMLNPRKPGPPAPPEVEPVAEERHVPELETPDAGVGDIALSEVIVPPRAAIPAYAFAAPMPKKAFPGQKRPPCSPRSEREVLGACWVVIDMRPPCGAEGYDYDGKCLRATYEVPRDPTSKDP